MKLSRPDIDNIRAALVVCRAAGIESVVITDNKVRGTTPTTKVSIISDVPLSFDSKLVIGIGRVDDFASRLALFPTDIAIEGKENDTGAVSLLTITGGRSRIQFRCTAERLIKYPKANNDEAVAYVKASKGEVQQLVRAIKTLGSETFVLAIGRDGIVRLESTSPTNETFAMELAEPVVFESDPQGVVHTYEGGRVASTLDLAVREVDDVTLIVGEMGSLTFTAGGQTMVAIPDANQEDDDE
jgi:hypothetical protein